MEAKLYHRPWALVPNKIRGCGGREIDRFRGIYPGVDYDAGSEAWIGSVTHVANPPKDKPYYGCSEVVLPTGERKFLFEAIAEDPQAVLGEKHMAQNGQGLGMLIKYLDAQRQYGLQCHPTREWAKMMWNSPYGKEESWFVIGTRDDTAEPAYILLGFKEGVTRADWEKEYYKGDIRALEKLCHKIPVKEGDAYFVAGGCPHALGEGCFVIEVQEPSDITLGATPYSLLDPKYKARESAEVYDERLLGAYVYEGCSYDENLAKRLAPREVFRSGAWGSESFVIGPKHAGYFSFTELKVAAGQIAPLRRTGFPQVGIVLAGEGKLLFDGGEMPVSKAAEIFIPYDVPELRAQGEMTLILCHPEGVTY